MDNTRLPNHVIAKVERRWANKLQREAKAWNKGKLGASSAAVTARNGSRSIPVAIKRRRRTAKPFSA
jgi:hypothetical protein